MKPTLGLLRIWNEFLIIIKSKRKICSGGLSPKKGRGILTWVERKSNLQFGRSESSQKQNWSEAPISLKLIKENEVLRLDTPQTSRFNLIKHLSRTCHLVRLTRNMAHRGHISSNWGLVEVTFHLIEGSEKPSFIQSNIHIAIICPIEDWRNASGNRENAIIS